MENNKAVVLALVLAAAVVITASGVYATMGRPSGANWGTYPNAAFGSGMGPSMMGDFGRNAGYGNPSGMMEGRGMMGTGYGPYSSMEDMRQYMWHYWNSTTVP